MGRGPKKHLKRIAAPTHWGLDKMGGYWAPRPRGGPHKLRECLPLVLVLRNKLKFALTKREAKIILQERNVLVDGKVKKDMKFPAGLMDVISIPKVGRHFRVLVDTIGRFIVKKISEKESKYKLVKVVKIFKTKGGFPAVSTNDGRVIRFVPPGIKLMDTLKISIPDQKILRKIQFKVGSLVMADTGRNCGRIGEIVKIEKHQATFHIVYCRDISGKIWTTRKDNLFVIGENKNSYISLPSEKGVKLDPVDFREKMMKEYVDKRKKKSKVGFSMSAVRTKIRKSKEAKKKAEKKGKKKTVKKQPKEEKPKETKEFEEHLKFRHLVTRKMKKKKKADEKKIKEEKKI